MAKKENERKGEKKAGEGGERSDIAQKEEAVLEFWRKNNIFEKSVEKDAPKGNYVFYDGPPFATGLPHYGHILISVIKDAVPRFWTMRGYRVFRRWGWDCHGLPIENIVERELGISGKKQIEETGIEEFNETARRQVLTFANEWKKTIERVGRWVDFDRSYKTMDNTFIESVWWAFKEVYKEGLVYEGTKVLPYCPRCETPIANAEIAMDNSYKDIKDISVYVKFPIEGEKDTFFLVWTTTPWTLPGNTALAVHPNEKYAKVSFKGNTYIVAQKRLADVFGDEDVEVENTISGKKLVGTSYHPSFTYFRDKKPAHHENGWKVYTADFVTMEEGTGIVHMAPAFGEDDMNLAREHDLPVVSHVGRDGKFSEEFGESEYGTAFAGRPVKPKERHEESDVEIIKNLHAKELLFKKEKITHAYPHCHRCETPLYYYAIPAWFIDIQKKKKEILKLNENINWIPEHLQHGRFGKSVRGAPDWNISRNRYWASPLPVWRSRDGRETKVIGSLEELKKETKRNTYIVMRHGEAVSNKENVVSARPDNPHPLTERGREQVRECIAALKKEAEQIDVIYASDFVRTRETAELIADAINYSKERIIFDKRLREIDTGGFNLKPIAEYRAYFESIREKFDKRPPGGENIHDVKLRVGEFLYDIDKKNEGKTILIVTHEYLVWMLEAVAGGLTDDEACFDTRTGDYIGNGEWRALPFAEIPHNRDYELDYHRPYSDRITLRGKDGRELARIPEVVDCWFESAAMPFAALHYPFEGERMFAENFPAQFIAEYVAQTRTWFYYTHALAVMLFDSVAFENVLTTGTILAEDGSKMSKSKGNFPDPHRVMDAYGTDALRYYLLSSPLLKAEDINFSEEGVREAERKVVARLRNVLAFFNLYRAGAEKREESLHVLDRWIFSRLNEATREVRVAMERYMIDAALRYIHEFIEDLSLWYVRRSRERFKEETHDAAYARGTLKEVLKKTALVVAPFVPFVAEEVYAAVRGKEDPESVHLAEWPAEGPVDEKLIQDMQRARGVVEGALSLRAEAGIKVRQPLPEVAYTDTEGVRLDSAIEALIQDEVNVKRVSFLKKADRAQSSRLRFEGRCGEVFLDTEVTEDLVQEGRLRELIRNIQDLRKEEGMVPEDEATLVVSADRASAELVRRFETEIKKAAHLREVAYENQVKGKEVRIPPLSFQVLLKR